MFNASPAGSGNNMQFVSSTAGVGVLELTLGVLMPSLGDGASGTSVAVYPAFASKGVFLNPMLGVMGYFSANIGAGSTVSFTYYGASHTYHPLGARASTSWNRGNPSGGSVLMLFE